MNVRRLRLLAAALCLSAPASASSQPPASGPGDSASADSLWRHDPYDLSQAAPVDSLDVYRSPRPNPVLAFPRYAWESLVYPFGRFTIFAEHAELVTRTLRFFTSRDRTLGLFPQVQLGGETGTGGGAKGFATNLFGRRKILTGLYVYSGGRGQTGEAMYLDPNLLGTGLLWRVDGLFLRTRNHNAAINASVRDDPARRFRLDRADLLSTLSWRLRRGGLSPFLPNTHLDAWGGWSRRDFRAFTGGTAPLTDPGSTAEAAQLRGIGRTLTFSRFGGRAAFDDRDYSGPTDAVVLPLNYRLPGRIAVYENGLYYSMRDLGYPERGGLVQAEAEVVTGESGFRFYRAGLELQRFFTLFWKDRILAVRCTLDRVRALGQSSHVPYPDLITLGGGDSARGYRRGAFRGQGALLFNVEYRWPIWDTWNAYLFWDESQIFDHFADVTSSGFSTSIGGGIAFRTEVGVIGKTQIGHSAGGTLLGFVFGSGF